MTTLAQEGLEALAPALLLALDDRPQVDRQGAVHLQVRLDRADMHVELALVVHRAAREELAVAHHRLERRCGPKLERLGRLDVVMPVEDRGRTAGSAQPLRVHHRVAGGRDHLGARHPDRAQAAGDMLGAAPHVVAVRRLRAHARNAERGLQVFDEAVTVLVEVAGEGVHPGLRRERWAGFEKPEL